MSEQEELFRYLTSRLDEVRERKFEPNWRKNKYGDCIEVWLKQGSNSYYGTRLNNAITIYRDDKTNEIVGIKMKNLEAGLNGENPNSLGRVD